MWLFLHLIHFSFTYIRETTFSQAGEGGDLLCELTNPFFATVLRWGFQFLVNQFLWFW